MERLASESAGFRRDVEGLRAIAVSMVLLYHLDVGWATGGFAGVDVFFVISGFLITGLLVKELGRTGRISLIGFYARRAKRLFPAAATVLVATAMAAWMFMPRTRLAEIGGDLFSAAFYFINWRLAERSVNYLAEDSVSSPVQHFWSLAVEEQYYIIWPVLLFAALFMLRKWLTNRAVLWSTVAAVALPSLAYSVYLTTKDPGPAYFITPTRLWELAIGGAIALAAGVCQRIPVRLARVLGWIGLAAIFLTTVAISTKTPWPGYAAALPTLGTAAVIVSGFSAGPRGPVLVLGTRAMCWIGGISYSLYLWHWPLITLFKRGGGEINLVSGAALALVSIMLAWATQRWVENPIRYSKAMSAHPRYALSTGLNFSFVGAVSGLALVILVGVGHPVATPAAANEGVKRAQGAAILREPPRDDPAGAPTDTVAWMTPLPEKATEDVPDVYPKGCQVGTRSTRTRSCTYGNEDAPVTVAIVGDSKMAQWASAFETLAYQHNWKVVTYTKSACSFNAAEMYTKGRLYTECHEWNRAVLALLTGKDKPDFVITSHGRSKRGVSTVDAAVNDSDLKEADPALVEGFVQWWKRLQSSGVKVIALADNPHPHMNVYECVSTNPSNLKACTFDRAEGNGTASLRMAAMSTGSHFVDLTDAICPTARCAPVIGNVLIYRQGSHITKTYIDTMSPRLGAALLAAGLPSGGKVARPAVVSEPPRVAQLPTGLRLSFQYQVRDEYERTTDSGQSRRRTILESLDADEQVAFTSIDSGLKQAGYRRMMMKRSERGAILATYRQKGNPRVSVSVSGNVGKQPRYQAAKSLISIDWAD